MVKEFKNNWAVILGGSSGLGLATAKKLSSHGMNICIVHRNLKSELREIENHFNEIRANEVSLIHVNKDLLKSENRKEILKILLDKLGKDGSIKCLIHSVAKGNLKPMLAEGNAELSMLDLEITVNAMALSLYDWFKAVYSTDKIAGDFRLISFTSEGGRKPLKNYAAVSAAKASLEAITRNIALEFATKGVRANCIQAGVTNTKSLRRIPGSEKIMKHAVNRNPFGRLTLEKDVANAVYLLCKDEAAWINGCIIPVDGGEHLS
ncbi:SDR family oxidoreductase [Lutimonas zeaxanthinifaciens]|uniref:SDR family oxidoreductase n=1 Tax=Lutimonas zeaxanthinifaciens TaxID=3060215 RepID=UPI00265CDFA1|nr:SDR family oxidoreductase [Lutimonas sp. YSD2104]WKK64902.1 SDR family oxidoreductase [Lutimonas sp. YSD2104]